MAQTLGVIVKDQLERLRDGDRFWCEICLPQDLLSQVRSESLEKIIRHNTAIGGEVQNNVFFTPGRIPMQRQGRR